MRFSLTLESSFVLYFINLELFSKRWLFPTGFHALVSSTKKKFIFSLILFFRERSNNHHSLERSLRAILRRLPVLSFLRCVLLSLVTGLVQNLVPHWVSFFACKLILTPSTVSLFSARSDSGISTTPKTYLFRSSFEVAPYMFKCYLWRYLSTSLFSFCCCETIIQTEAGCISGDLVCDVSDTFFCLLSSK